MQEKFVSATQTQVATKISTKTKILLGLIMVSCLGGMFAIVGGLNYKSTNVVGEKNQRPTNISSRKNDGSFYALSRCHFSTWAMRRVSVSGLGKAGIAYLIHGHAQVTL